MAKCIKLNKRYGQKAIALLKKKGWLASETKLGKTMNYLIIPVKDNTDFEHMFRIFPKVTIETRNLKQYESVGGDLKDLLKGVIPTRALKYVNSSFDVIGDIAILDIPDNLKKYDTSIAWTLKRNHHNIKTVVKRADVTKGEHRIRKVKVLAGENTTETIYKESGVQLKLDLNKTYFSPRLGTERLRISNLVGGNERILVMFAGIGPYPLIIIKKHPDCEITAVELNKDAVDYFKENLKLNKNIFADKQYASLGKKVADRIGKKIKVIRGDVAETVPEIEGNFDRIIMPAPFNASEYLDLALQKVKKGGFVHLYQFSKESNIETEARDTVSAAAKKAGRKVKILNIVKCGAYAPYVFRVCVDLQVVS